MEVAARHEKETSGLLARLRAAVKAGHSMYICMCKPSTGVAAGLGLILAARPGAASGAVVAEVIAGGAAALAGRGGGKSKGGTEREVSKGDLLLEVDGVEVVSSSLTEIESLLCGPVGTSVTIKASSTQGRRYSAVIERGCEGDLHSESAVQTLAGEMQEAACTAARQQRQELEQLRLTHGSAVARHTVDQHAWSEEKEQLQSEATAARQDAEVARQERRDAMAVSLQHDAQVRQQQQRASLALQHLHSHVKTSVADLVHRLDRVEGHRHELERGQTALQGKLRALALAHNDVINDCVAQSEARKAAQLEKQAFETQVREMAKALDQSQVLLGEVQAAKKEAQAAAKKLADDHAAAQGRLTQVLPEMEANASTVQQLRAAVKRLESEEMQLRSRVNCAQIEKEELLVEIREVQQLRTQAVIASNAAADKIKQLEEEKTNSQSALSELRVRLASIEAETATVTDALSSKRAQLASENDRREALEAEAQRLQLRYKAQVIAAEDARAAAARSQAACVKAQTQVKDVITVAQAMYVSAVRPQAGVVMGLGFTLHELDKQVCVEEVLLGGAASDSAAMASGDILLAVDGTSTAELSLQEVEQLLAGPALSPVCIVGRGSGGEYTLELQRRCGLSADIDAAVASIQGYMQSDAVNAAEKMHAKLAQLSREAESAALKSERESAALKTANNGLRIESTDLAAKLTAAEQQVQELTRELSRASQQQQAESRKLVASAADARAAANSAHAELDALRVEANSLKSQLALSLASCEASREDVTRTLAEADAARAERAAAKQEAEEAAQLVHVAVAERQDAQAKARKADEAAAAAAAAAAQSASELAVVAAQLAQAEAEVASVKEREEQQSLERGRAQAEATRLAAEKEESVACVSGVRGQVSALEAQLKAAEQALEQKRQRVAELQAP